MKRKRKVIGLLLMGALLLSQTACKKTPEPLVVQKDADRLEEQAQQEPQDNSLREITKNLPDNYPWQDKSEDGTVSISTRAKIQVPSLDAMPSYAVESQVWEQADVDRFIDLFFPGEDVYDPDTIVHGKDYYLEHILALQEMLATGIDNKTGSPLDDDNRKSAEDHIAYLQGLYDAAPEKTQPPELSSRLLHPGATEEYGRFLDVCDLENQRTLQISTGGTDTVQDASISYTDYQNFSACGGLNLNENNGRELLQGESLPPEAENIPISFEDAKALAQATFGALDENLVLDRAFLVDDAYEAGIEYCGTGANTIGVGETQEASHWAYAFYFVRQVDGIPIKTRQGFSRKSNSFNSYSVAWEDEEAFVLIGDKGIAWLQWSSPLNPGKTLSEDSGLVPFRECTQIFEGIVSAQYRGTTIGTWDDSVTPCEVEVNRVSLELIRVRSGSDREGLLVPAWVFYGTLVRHSTDSATGEPVTELYGNTLPMAIGAVNAIDGTFIATDDLT